MRFVKAIFDTGYADGDGARTMLYKFPDDADDKYISQMLEIDANEFFEDHEYLGVQWEYDSEEEEEEDREMYYDSCSWWWENSTKAEWQRWEAGEYD